MKIFFYFIYFYILILIKANSEITENKKERVKACITLQKLKFKNDNKRINEFIKNKSEIYKVDNNTIVLLSMAFCYNKISAELSNKINAMKNEHIDIGKLGIEDIYNFENYNYDDLEINTEMFNNFYPVFEVVYKEIKEKEKEKSNSIPEFKIYFLHTPLFNFFLFYTLINSIIVFYIRFKDLSKYNDSNKEIESKKQD